MRLHHLALSPARAGSASDVPGGVAAATADLPSKTLCPQSPASQAATSATSVQPMRTHWCRRHPGWHLPINELWHRASRPCAPGEGTLVVCVVALATKVLAVVLCVGVRQTTPSNAYSAKPCQRWRAACWCAQWAAVWRNSHCRGSLPSRWRAWLSALELMGSLCCPGSASSSTSATFTMERSLSKATPNTSQSACSMGSRRLRSVATPVICKACSIHCWGMLLFERHPIVRGSQTHGYRSGTLAAALAIA